MSMTIQFAKGNHVLREGLNLANSNMATVFACLGYDVNQAGSDEIPIDEFIKSIELFFKSDMAAIVDAGRDPRETETLGVKVIDMSGRAGYVTEKLKLILTDALNAKLKGAENVFAF